MQQGYPDGKSLLLPKSGVSLLGCQSLATAPTPPGADTLLVPLPAPPQRPRDGRNPKGVAMRGPVGSSSPSSAHPWAGNAPLLSSGCPRPPQGLCPALLAETRAHSVPVPWKLCPCPISPGKGGKHLCPPLLDVNFAVTAAPEDEGDSCHRPGHPRAPKQPDVGGQSHFPSPSTPKEQQPRLPCASTSWDTRVGQGWGHRAVPRLCPAALSRAALP